MGTAAQNEFETLLKEIKEYEKNITSRDSHLKNAVFFELLCNEVQDRTSSDLEATLYINKYLLNKGIDLKIAENGFYTVTGAQYLCHKQVPYISIPGRVFRETTSDKAVSFTEKNNILWKFLNKESYIDKRKRDYGSLNKKGKDAYNFIFDQVVGNEIDIAFSEETTKYVDEMVARNSIAFQAINNGISFVEKALNDYHSLEDGSEDIRYQKALSRFMLNHPSAKIFVSPDISYSRYETHREGWFKVKVDTKPDEDGNFESCDASFFGMNLVNKFMVENEVSEYIVHPSDSTCYEE